MRVFTLEFVRRTARAAGTQVHTRTLLAAVIPKKRGSQHARAALPFAIVRLASAHGFQETARGVARGRRTACL